MDTGTEKQVQALLSSVDKAFLQLGELLAEAQSIEGKDFCTFLKMVGRRRGYHLVRIYRLFVEAGLVEEELAAIGWTKLSIIAPKVTTKNVNDYLQLAKSLPARQLKLAVTGRPPSDAARAVVLYLTDADYVYFRHLMVQYGAKSKGNSLVGQDHAFAEFLDHISEILGD